MRDPIEDVDCIITQIGVYLPLLALLPISGKRLGQVLSKIALDDMNYAAQLAGHVKCTAMFLECNSITVHQAPGSLFMDPSVRQNVCMAVVGA